MADIEAAAQHLCNAWRTRAPYETLSGNLAPEDLGTAYQIQHRLQTLLAAERGPMAGRKIALSSHTMQQMLGIDHPIAGAFFQQDIHHGSVAINASTFRHIGLECELAVELSRDIEPGENHDATTAYQVISNVRPAFELIEDRGADYAKIDVLTLAADNAWCGGVILGAEIPGWHDLDFNNVPSVLEQKGQAPEEGNTGAADPLNSLAWVLNHFSGRGETIQKGEFVITGSVLRTRFPKPGDQFIYRIGDHASVSLEIV